MNIEKIIEKIIQLSINHLEKQGYLEPKYVIYISDDSDIIIFETLKEIICKSKTVKTESGHHKRLYYVISDNHNKYLVPKENCTILQLEEAQKFFDYVSNDGKKIEIIPWKNRKTKVYS